MILVRSPLRITLGGGGTDLPSYAQTFGGYCLTAAIDRYVYVAALKPFAPGIYLKYSTCEHREAVEEVTHPIIRACLELCNTPDQIEITALADIPGGTGLGSSSAFTVALLQALTMHNSRRAMGWEALAETAAHVEIDRLGEPIGKQDHYAAALGGVLEMTIHTSGRVEARPLEIPPRFREALEDRLLLFYTGMTRPARTLLSAQHAATVALTDDMLRSLHTVHGRAVQAAEVLRRGGLHVFGEILHEHWMEKRRRSPGMTNAELDGWYDLARANGAVGGKLVGAGGGGCFLFYTESPEQLRAGLAGSGLEEIRFRFDVEGTKVLLATA